MPVVSFTNIQVHDMKLEEALHDMEEQKISLLEPDVTDEDYYIPNELKRDIEGAALTIKNIKQFGKMGDRHYLFTGPPGTGKTLGVLYLATKVGGLVYDGKNIGSAEKIRQTFAFLRETFQQQQKPIFFVMNEVDRLSNRDDVVDPQQQERLTVLLDEMQGFEENDGIYIIGTTNKPDSLDSALRRPGRFSKEIEFMPPNKQGRQRILEIHAYKKEHKFVLKKADLEALAAKTFGYTGADLCGLLNESFVEALRRGDKNVNASDMDYAFSKVKPSAIRDIPFREPSLKLDDLAGYAMHKELLRKIITNNNGATMMFYGPPGTGKTVFAEAVAGEFGYTLLFVSGSELESKWVGESKDRLAKVYARAKQLRPCIVALDEVDSFLETKGAITHQKEQSGYIQSVLSKPEDGVYVIATTNNPHYLKDAMLDRFLFKLFFHLPHGAEQEAVWTKYLPEGIPSGEMVLDGLSCRTIADACRKATTYGHASKDSIKRLVAGKIKSR